MGWYWLYWIFRLGDKKRKSELYKMEEDSVKTKYQQEIDNLPKKYDYLCKTCLFQTNTFSKICPKCNKGRLSRTSGHHK
jgi:lipopolysaccharide biosynthesis regulator YciM